MSKMLAGGFYNSSVGAYATNSIGNSDNFEKQPTEIHQNTLQFINLSLNAAEQYRHISYRQEGLPKKSLEEEKKHRELVYQTK